MVIWLPALIAVFPPQTAFLNGSTKLSDSALTLLGIPDALRVSPTPWPDKFEYLLACNVGLAQHSCRE